MASMPISGIKFGEMLRSIRKKKGITPKDLSDRVGISRSYLAYIESGKKTPKPHVIEQLSDALALTWAERARLRDYAGVPVLPESPVIDVIAEVKRALLDAAQSPEELGTLAVQVKAYVAKLRSQRQARYRNIDKAIIPYAGWQPRLLSPIKIEKALVHVADEARNASISELIFVVAPEPTFPKLADRFGLKVSTVVQSEPLGLGHAIAMAKDFVSGEPFAVILPDEVDPARSITRELKTVYEHLLQSIVAVNPTPVRAAHEAEHFGVVLLDPHGPRKRTFRVMELSEKPKDLAATDGFGTAKQAARMHTRKIIAGRYILTPDIFDALQETGKNDDTGKIELTDALNRNIRTSNSLIYAYELNQPLLPLAPFRRLLESMIDAIDDSDKFGSLVRTTEKLLRHVGGAGES